nr:hypothetical protein 13 [Gammaproteobacteria bacterium]
MSKTIYVKPAVAGQKVHLEGKGGEFLPEDGAEVPENIYWLRRLRDGSVVTTKKPAKQVGSTKEG